MDRNNNHESNFIEDNAPETPAPIFAFRAFKQALFGTPKHVETQKSAARRRAHQQQTSKLPEERTTPNGLRHLDRRASLFETQNLTPSSSPQKRSGILVTPGTAGKSRKTVSFDGKKRLQTRENRAVNACPTPNAVSGRFPSSNAANNGEIGSTRPKMNRDQFVNDQQLAGEEQQREIRKVLKREQIAKKFAKFKEDEANQLKEELAKERKKVEELETKLEKYVAMLERSNAAETTKRVDQREDAGGVEDDETPARVEQNDGKQRRSQRRIQEEASASRDTYPFNSLGKAPRRRTQRLSTTGRPVEKVDSFASSLEAKVQNGESDMWADLGSALLDNNKVEPLVDTKSGQSDYTPRTKGSTKVALDEPARNRQRTPLSVVDTNAVESKGSSSTPSKTKSPKPEGLDEQRLAAARLRLQEKRKTRLGL